MAHTIKETKLFTTVLFSCKSCNLDKQAVEVAARVSDDDVVAWLRSIVMPKVALAHVALSPGCPARTCDVMLPASGEIVGEGTH